MNCIIKWNRLSLSEWEEYFNKISRSTLLQSYDYARSICPLNRQKARWALVEIDGAPAGLAQILEARLFGTLFHALVLDRGPLWFDGFGSNEHFEAFVCAFKKEFPQRWGRKCRFIPEIPDSSICHDFLLKQGFKRQTGAGYKTLWIDLRMDLETLRAQCVKSWRGALKKAERSNLTVKWDDRCAFFSWFLKEYERDRAKKGYDGPSKILLNAMAQNFAPQKNFLIACALTDGKPIAAILVVCHGLSATYQVGWTLDEGRKVAAHHLLLFEALETLKRRGITDFDLGGVNDEEAAGVKKFKEGLGGTAVTLPGLYTW